MKSLLTWLRNVRATRDAYSGVNSQFGEDLVGDPLFAVLRDFADAPAEPNAVPLHLLRQYNAAQKHARGRKRFRIGSGALFGVIVLVPSLAYAGVLPTPVAKMVQRVFNVISIPIQIPSVTNPSSPQSPTTSNGAATTPATQAPESQPSQTPEAALPAPSDSPSETPKISVSTTVSSGDDTTPGEAELNPSTHVSASAGTTVEGSGTVDSTPDPAPSLDATVDSTLVLSPTDSDSPDEN
jgi:hypothetical protein